MENMSDLISRSVTNLEEKVLAKTTNNVPVFPIAIIYAGEKAGRARKNIEMTMRNVWRARAEGVCQMQYLNHQYFLCQKENSGPLSDDEIQEALGNLFTDSRYFSSFNNLMLCTVLDTDDYDNLEDFQEGYLLADNLKQDLGMSACYTMKIVLLNEFGRGMKFSAQVRDYLDQLMQQDAQKTHSTVLLSNKMNSGVLLAGERIRENYALAGNLIILANSRDSSDQFRYARMFPMESPRYVTAAYSQKSKPNREITIVILNTLLAWIGEQIVTDQKLSEDQLSEKLNISQIAEEIFNKTTAGKIPENYALDYLPRNCDILEPISNKPFREFNHITFGSFENFYQNTLGSLFRSEDFIKSFRQSFCGFVHSCLTPREACLSLNPQVISSILDRIRLESPSDTEPAFQYMVKQLKKDYYQQIIPICREVLEDYCSAAKQQIEKIKNLIQEFREKTILPGDASLMTYYRNLTMDNLGREMGQNLLARINKPDITESSILDAFYTEITGLFSNNDIFSLPMDDEMTRRIGADPSKILTLIKDGLTGGLSQSIRLQTVFSPSIDFSIILADQDGTLYNQLTAALPNSQFLDTGNKNIIEFIQLCSLGRNIL